MKQHLDFSHILVFVILFVLLLITIISMIYTIGYNYGKENSQNSTQCKITTTNTIVPCVKAEPLVTQQF